jgi:hypothetical protein
VPLTGEQLTPKSQITLDRCLDQPIIHDSMRIELDLGALPLIPRMAILIGSFPCLTAPSSHRDTFAGDHIVVRVSRQPEARRGLPLACRAAGRVAAPAVLSRS